MAKANGTFTYPMSSQKDIADAGSNYDNILSEFTNGTAFRDVTVNPILKTTHVTSETTTSSVTSVPSVIFTEIRKGPHDSSISNDSNSQIGNRILPVNTTITDHGTARDSSAPFKIKVYDPKVSGDTNRKFVYSTTDSPATDTLGIDIDNYDYFIILNPSIIQDTSSTTQTSVRPHFAKITAITSFEEFGDGLEFTPRYPVPVPKGTNFEVFKGPAKTTTDIVAVSYGLRGDANANTDNYDVLNVVSKPTFYFYNERLEQDDQLDYMEKYTLTRLRWLSTLTNITITDTDAHTKYQEGSSSVRFEVANSTHTDILCEGMSIFNSSNVFLGNIKDITGNFFQLDFARIAISADTSNSQTYKIGRGIQNIVFRTEARIKGTIPNKGRQKLDAVLVDNLRNTDNSDNNFNPSFWRKSFVNMRRHEQDSTTVTVNASHFDGELNGPARYITSDPRPFRSDKVSPMTDIVVNSPRNRMSKIAKLIALNNSGILPRKISRGQKLRVLNTKFSDKTTMKELPVLASKTTSANTITFTEIPSSHDYKLSEKLPTNSILEIGDYYYVVDSFGTKSGSSQVLTTKARKTLTENTFTATTTIHEFTNLVPKVVFWTGVLNTEDFDSETDVIYADNHRLSVSDSTIKKENTKFYNSRITFNSLSHHENLVDFIDRNMEYVKFQSPDRKFYQGSSIQRFYYYDNSYSLQEEVFTGVIESTDNMTENGLSTMTIEGRDNSSSLLNKLVKRDLVHTEDMLHSSLNPIVSAVNTATMNVSGVNDKVISHTAISNWNNTATPKMLLFTRSTNQDGTINNQDEHMIFIGEVASATTTATTLTHKPLVSLSINADNDIFYYDPFTEATYLSGVKAIASNPSVTSSTDFKGTSDKGIVFQDGLKLSRATNGTISTTNLKGTSNTGSYLRNRSLGYDVGSLISIDSLNEGVTINDSTFIIRPVNDSGVTIEDSIIPSFTSETFDVVSISSKDDGGATLSIAPRCPIVMGRLENNTSDTRTSYSFYLVNNNLNSGGFIHRIDAQDGGTATLDYTGADEFYTPRETYRYWDLQRLNYGSVTKSDAGLYLNSKSPQAIGGYAIAYPIKGNGVAPSSPTLSPSTAPILGSNMLDDNYTLRHSAGSPFTTVGASTPPTSLPTETVVRTGSEASVKPEIAELLNYSPSAQNYELFATGDLFPYSKLRYNNIGNRAMNFSSFSCLLESEGSQSNTSISHSSYSGKTNVVERKDSNYEAVSIKSASKTTDQIKRFGIARLVEATYDWHFNPIDSDDLPTPDETKMEISKYQMFRQQQNINNLNVVIDGTDNKITFGGGGTVTVNNGDVIFRKDTGQAVFVCLGSNVAISSNTASTNLINVTGSTTALTTPAYMIKDYGDLSFPIMKFSGESFNDPIFSGFGNATGRTQLEVDNAVATLDFTSVYLLKGTYSSQNGLFKFGLLKRNGSGTLISVVAPNLYLPMIFDSSFSNDASTSLLDKSDQSPYHPPKTWHTLDDGNNNDNYFNSSRVIAGMLKDQAANSHGNNFTATSITTSQKYGLAEGTSVYDNCIAVFRNIRKASSDGLDVPDDMIQTSAMLGLQTDEAFGVDADVAAHSQQFGGGVTDNTNDLHTDNVRVFQIPTSGSTGVVTFAVAGTVTRTSGQSQATGNSSIGTEKYFLNEAENGQIDTDRFFSYNDITATVDAGGLYKAQMMIKPLLDISESDVSLNSDRDVITITTSGTTNHAWVTFVPELTGHYLVSEKEEENGLDRNLGSVGIDIANNDHDFIHMKTKGGNISYLSKIIKHETNQTSMSQGTITHTLTLDNPIPPDETVGTQHHGLRPKYRLMRLAEKTFRDTPNEIILNRLHGTGLDYSMEASSFLTGQRGDNHQSFSTSQNMTEGVYSAYVLMNLDVAPPSSDNHSLVPALASLSSTNLPFVDGDTFDCFITDGVNKHRKLVTASITPKSRTGGVRFDERKLTFEGTLTGNGVVSFGEIINLELDRKPDLDNISFCHIGARMTIGSEVETEIDRIAKSAGMTTDTIQTQSVFTGNIVSSVSNNQVTCKKDVVGVSVGDILYTHEGLPLGKVSGVSNAVITFNDVHTHADIDLWYTPLVNDELIRREKKTFIATNNFTEVSAFDAMNTLASKKEMDFNVRGKHVDFRKLRVTSGLTKKKINYKNNRIFKIDTNAELFAKANKVTVVGDRISATAQIDEEGTELTFVDSTIKNSEDAKVKANELLELHSQDTRKIKLRLEKKGLEILEAGDIVELDFPAQSIPSGQYVIFEIENVLTSQITMTVGTFSKTIAERLSELGTGQRENTSTTFGKNSISVTGETLLKDKLNIRVTNVMYTISGTGAVSNVGFGAKVGFFDDGGSENLDAEIDSSGTEVGFSRASVGVLLEYDSED